MPDARGPLAGKKGLVVEDELLIALDLEDTLQSAGAEILSAGRVEEALDLLNRTADLDFAVLDMHLGHDTSLPIAAVLAGRNIPFAFLSGLGKSDTHLRQFPQAHAIAKPFHAPTLIAAIAEALARR